MKFLTRFQRLERARPEHGSARHRTGERFQALEPEAPLPELRSAPLQRFTPAVEPLLELAPRSDAQPFVRCPSCRVDSPAGTRRCRCGAVLDTVEAVAFNAELWDRYRRDEAEDARQRRASGSEVEGSEELHRRRQALGEEIAREISARERRRDSGSRVGLVAGVTLLAVVGLLMLPRGLPGRLLLALALGVVTVRILAGWFRSRANLTDRRDGPSVEE